MTPNYYAEGEVRQLFRLQGSGFLSIPQDAVGLFAYQNDKPLQFIDAVQDTYLLDVNVISDTEMEVTGRIETFHYANYLGGIVSNDRQIVFWTNNSMPIP